MCNGTRCTYFLYVSLPRLSRNHARRIALCVCFPMQRAPIISQMPSMTCNASWIDTLVLLGAYELSSEKRGKEFHMKSMSAARSQQILALLAVAQLMGVLDFSIVNVALP